MTNPLLDEENKLKIAKELGVEVADLSNLLLEAVWEQITNYIGYDPMLQPRNEDLEGNGISKLYLTARPIKSIEKLTVNGNVIKDTTFTDRYINICTTKENCRCEIDYLYDYPITDKISVEYTAGYKKIPAKILMASIMLLQTLTSAVGEESSLKNYKINTISYTFKDFSERAEEYQGLLDEYRVIL